jgi:2-phospho-L-lactate guanylyltransferase
VVPDAEGTGTVLLTATPGHLLAPSFGAGSAARHATGATLLTPDLPRLRQDVDDVGSLAEAVQLGVGRHTAAVLARACLPGGTA